MDFRGPKLWFSEFNTDRVVLSVNVVPHFRVGCKLRRPAVIAQRQDITKLGLPILTILVPRAYIIYNISSRDIGVDRKVALTCAGPIQVLVKSLNGS